MVYGIVLIMDNAGFMPSTVVLVSSYNAKLIIVEYPTPPKSPILLSMLRMLATQQSEDET